MLPTAETATLDAVFQRAYQAHQAGHLALAKQGYEHVLQYLPGHPDALHLLGLVAHASGEEAPALRYLQQAVAVAPQSWVVHSNLGEVYRSMGRLDDALGSHARAVRLQPESAVAHFNLALVQWAQGQSEVARASLERVVTLAPMMLEGWLSLGQVYEAQEDLDAAVCAYTSAACLEPTCLSAYRRLGVLWHQQGQHEPAIAALQTARRLAPDCAEVHTNLGVVLQALGRYATAIACYEAALTYHPTCPQTLYNLGTAWQALEQPEKARQAYEAALQFDPESTETHFNLGIIWEQLQRPDAAIAAYQAALRLQPQHAGAHMNSALLWLAQGRLPQGWEAYEWRWHTPEWTLPARPLPRWQGTTLPDGPLLVQAEQGVGDEIQFASCLPDLLARVGQLVIECDPRLAPMFTRSFPSAVICGVPRDACEPAWLYHLPAPVAHVPSGSLSRFLRPALGCFPAQPGYLLPHPLRCEKWRVRLQALGTGLKIGMTWRGLVTTNKRSPFYTSLADWAPLFAIPGIVWVNLQYGECAADLADARRQWGVTIHTWADLDLLHDLEEVAALMAALDLIVAPANTVAQLAGSLGAPVWKCSVFAGDWGGLGTEVHPWFPTMRVYRQPLPGDWQSVFTRMANDLRSWT